MTITLAILALALLPSPDVAVDSVDLIEVNHYHDDDGEHVFDQLIFWTWDREASRYQVRAWRLLKPSSPLPQRNLATGEYEVLWHDGEVTRRVRAKVYRESWTQVDVEMEERRFLPKERRCGLLNPRLSSTE